MDKELLRSFIIQANNAGYASGEDKKWIKEENGSTTILFESGDFKMRDNFFGGEPYGGNEVIFYKNKPVWMMVYYGYVKEGIETDLIYKTLRSALSEMPSSHPFRGPKSHKTDDLTYENVWEGEIDNFSGKEEILKDKNILYSARYIGGLVDARKDV